MIAASWEAIIKKFWMKYKMPSIAEGLRNNLLLLKLIQLSKKEKCYYLDLTTNFIN